MELLCESVMPSASTKAETISAVRRSSSGGISSIRLYLGGVAVPESEVWSEFTLVLGWVTDTSVPVSDHVGNAPGGWRDLLGTMGERVGVRDRGGVRERERKYERGGGTGRIVVGESVMSDAADEGVGGESQN
jgi:hypothetical protein